MSVSVHFLEDLVRLGLPDAPARPATAGPGFFSSLLNAMRASRERQARIELARHAGLIDAMERRRDGASAWSAKAAS